MVKCNYLFGIDNILDISHAAFVHGETLGSLAIAQSPPQVSITEKDVRVLRNLKQEPAPPMYQSLLGLKEIDRSQEVIYWPIGNTRVETVARPPGQTEGRALRAYTTTIFTPATETETHVFVGMHRDFAVDNPQLTDVIAQKINSTVDEDRDVAEALQGNWDPDAPMIDIALDAPATAARRMLSKLLELESPEHKDSTLLRRPCRSSPANAGSREDAGLVQLNGGLS
jgi:vanillate O-demethylase monooxygenase subunit